jgi:cell division protein FtsW (lipid II flippase)
VGLGAGLYAIYTAETTLSFLRPHQMKRIQVFRAPLEDALRPIFRPFQPAGVEQALAGLGTDPTRRAPTAEAGPGETEGETAGAGAPTSAEARREAALEARKAAAAVWQIQQAEMALGSGRMFGKGWGKGTQSREGFLPAHYTDFIFCSLGEQFGMVGCFLLLGLYLLIAWRALHVAATASDPFGRCLVVGLLAVILLHVFFNVGMTVRLLPVTGLPLPLMSYGGSFLATNYLILGLIANVSMRR